MESQADRPDVDMQRDVGAFAIALKTARALAGYSQRDLSSRLFLWCNVEIDASGLSRIENGERVPRLDEAVALSRVLHFEIPGVYRSDPNHHEDAYLQLIRRVERATAYLNGQED